MHFWAKKCLFLAILGFPFNIKISRCQLRLDFRAEKGLKEIYFNWKILFLEKYFFYWEKKVLEHLGHI